MNLENGKVLTSKSVGTGPSSYEKRIYRAAVSQMSRNTGLDEMNMRLLLPKSFAKIFQAVWANEIREKDSTSTIK